MISYAGVGLTPPIDAQDRVSHLWHGHLLRQFERPFYDSGRVGMSHLPAPARQPHGPPRVGVLHWPVGASRWATCHLLASGEQLAAVRTALGAAPSPKTLSMDDGRNPAIEAEMCLLPPTPIAQRGERELYLLTLVDERYWWPALSQFSWWQESPGATSAEWVRYLGLAVAATRVHPAPTYPEVAAAYGVPDPDKWSFPFKPGGAVIDSLCEACGLRFVRDRDGTSRFVAAADAVAAEGAAWEAWRYEVIAGGRATPADVGLSLPAEVVVGMPGPNLVGAPSGSGFTSAELLSPAPGDYSPYEAVSLASLAPAELDGVAPFRLATTACYGSVNSSALLTGTTLTEHARRLAADYYLWSLSRTDCDLRGLVARPLTGIEDAVEWAHLPSGEMLTRVLRTPYGDRNSYGDRKQMLRWNKSSTTAIGAVTVAAGWLDTTFRFTLPSAGVYDLSATVFFYGQGTRTLGTPPDTYAYPCPPKALARFYNVTTGAAVDAGTQGVSALGHAACPLRNVVQVTGRTVMRIDVAKTSDPLQPAPDVGDSLRHDGGDLTVLRLS